MTHPVELREQAREHRAAGMPVKEIAELMGIPEPTIVRWTNPALEERERERARRIKFTKGKACPKCGKPISNNATICRSCYITNQRVWTAERIVQAIKDWAIEHGNPPSYTDWQRSGPGHPALRSITDGPAPVFRRWSDAIVAAGFVPYQRRVKRGGRRKLTEAQKRERAALRRQLREDKIKQAVEKGEQ